MGIIEKLYEKLYKKVGGEPWTYKIRKEQQAEPLVFMLVFLAIGIAIKYTGKNWWQLVIALLFGILIGHLFW